MPLIFAPVERALKVIKIMADDKTKKHLENLGITINSELQILNSGSSVIVLIKATRLALDSGLASKIFVVQA
ncbi:MAG TPA: ferrous iron transport protein A [Candidatus Stercoripulliclostridium merdigallinarum]|uniref:Ferrous iron transport protein A n=1 Tax=Candidatus Stercoripulliclostridium merdigallinarum TaxID=2840951 RepID=A0A9D1MH87_9FIRM|nr:ferrous iron transport protein A [Candidatus Stercoripulliclostridium merdigallinarum]